jgi:hypothetical protein
VELGSVGGRSGKRGREKTESTGMLGLVPLHREGVNKAKQEYIHATRKVDSLRSPVPTESRLSATNHQAH